MQVRPTEQYVDLFLTRLYLAKFIYTALYLIFCHVCLSLCLKLNNTVIVNLSCTLQNSFLLTLNS